MPDKIASDATPHPRQGIPRRTAKSTTRNENPSDSKDDLDLAAKTAPTTSGSNSRPQSRGANRKTLRNETPHADSDSEESSLDSFDEEEEDDDDDDRTGRRQRRRRRLSASASHLLAQAPAVPDLRFDHNYRKALDQCYESYAADSARAAARAAAYAASVSEKPDSKSRPSSSQQEHAISVPSVAARITVMTLRDIIIMPFVHGFFWGFGTVLLTLAGQRSLFYHIHRTWTHFFGSSGADEKPMTIRGEPARVRRFGGGSSLTGLGLMSAGSAAPGFDRTVY
ncbi:hypothetical protein EMPS_02356 [Entomortierella parvispora]|uniref:Uncharacterized protein n=1 Tax=Entomortierella parvispora TaxID=205924 RepID=A0A9P3H5A1_9FUNG|nr:hypothetical protein EMPS_02356 [Entomortierella parvispora]